MRKVCSGTLQIAVLTAGAVSAQVAPPPAAIPNGPAPVLSRGEQVSFNGSVPGEKATEAVLQLSLRDAIQRGLKYNLGILTNRDSVDAFAAERRRALSALLPNVAAGFTQNSAQNSLVAFGLSVPGFPKIVGPFGYENLRVYAQQTIYDKTALKNYRSAQESLKAAQLTADDARNLVVQAVSNAYLEAIAAAARVTAIRAEVNTAQALFERATDQKLAGTIPGIDVLRAEVELRAEQQRLVAQSNSVEKDKLALARVIGLAAGQQFVIADTLPFTTLPLALEDLLKQASGARADLKAAEANVRAAQLAVEAAHAEHMPSVVIQGDYGDIGRTLLESHGTYSFVAGVRVPIYGGGRTRADVEAAEAVVHNKQNLLADLRGRVDFEVRGAFLDLQSAADQVTVAGRNVELAGLTLTQARDRFIAGVTNSIEVVQAQQLLATANDSYISALAAHNAAKVSLAAALGAAQDGIPRFLNLAP